MLCKVESTSCMTRYLFIYLLHIYTVRLPRSLGDLGAILLPLPTWYPVAFASTTYLGTLLLSISERPTHPIPIVLLKERRNNMCFLPENLTLDQTPSLYISFFIQLFCNGSVLRNFFKGSTAQKSCENAEAANKRILI